MTDSEDSEEAAGTRVTRRAKGDRDPSGVEAASEDVTWLREPRAPDEVSPNDLSPIEDSSETPPSEADAGGRRLSHYEIVSRIGVGGMGEVYRAKDLSLGRDVAIKVVQESFSSEPDRLERFEREARAAAALNHPNVATVYEIGEHEGTRFIAMELVEGRTLGELLKKGPLPMHLGAHHQGRLLRRRSARAFGRPLGGQVPRVRSGPPERGG